MAYHKIFNEIFDSLDMSRKFFDALKRFFFFNKFNLENYLKLLYNCGRIIFILSFFVVYILSFGLVRLSARASAHTECRCSRARTEDVTITNVIIKTPNRK